MVSLTDWITWNNVWEWLKYALCDWIVLLGLQRHPSLILIINYEALFQESHDSEKEAVFHRVSPVVKSFNCTLYILFYILLYQVVLLFIYYTLLLRNDFQSKLTRIGSIYYSFNSPFLQPISEETKTFPFPLKLTRRFIVEKVGVKYEMISNFSTQTLWHRTVSDRLLTRG